MREKICFGGTFNPIHHGHLICARAVAEAVGASTMVIFPNGTPSHKTRQTDVASATDRLEMCRLAVASQKGFQIDDRECLRSGSTFTIDTARELKRDGWTKITWVIGADMLNTLPTWHEAEALIREVEFLIMARPGTQLAWQTLPPAYQALERNVIPVPQIDISATDIRRRVARGLPIDFLCPPAVCRYIADHRLYQT